MKPIIGRCLEEGVEEDDEVGSNEVDVGSDTTRFSVKRGSGYSSERFGSTQGPQPLEGPSSSELHQGTETSVSAKLHVRFSKGFGAFSAGGYQMQIRHRCERETHVARGRFDRNVSSLQERCRLD